MPIASVNFGTEIVALHRSHQCTQKGAADVNGVVRRIPCQVHLGDRACAREAANTSAGNISALSMVAVHVQESSVCMSRKHQCTQHGNRAGCNQVADNQARMEVVQKS
jgi:hypothetical protein